MLVTVKPEAKLTISAQFRSRERRRPRKSISKVKEEKLANVVKSFSSFLGSEWDLLPVFLFLDFR